MSVIGILLFGNGGEGGENGNESICCCDGICGSWNFYRCWIPEGAATENIIVLLETNSDLILSILLLYIEIRCDMEFHISIILHCMKMHGNKLWKNYCDQLLFGFLIISQN